MHTYVGSFIQRKKLFRKKWTASTAGVIETEYNSLEKRLKDHIFEVTKKENGQIRSRGL